MSGHMPSHISSHIPASALELGLGEVMHRRSRPASHGFVYPVFCLRIAVRRLQQIKSHSLFGLNRWRPLAFYSRDHGDGSGDLLGWLQQQVAKAGLTLPAGEIWLQAFPRVLGYVFNPVSFWYLHASDGSLRMIMAEVNNTFGEHHQYLLTADADQPINANTRLVCRKAFHVSPFCEVTGYYVFRYLGAGQSHAMAVDYFEDKLPEQPLIATEIRVQTQPASRRNLLAAWAKMPLLTLGVVWRIHWQALRLWLKHIPYHKKPAPPGASLSFNQRKPGHEK